ncbi:hypothetical protein LSAT2_031618, partial [Lamellibrachia satsuma]
MVCIKVCLALLALCSVLTAGARRDARRPERRPWCRDARQPPMPVPQEPATALPAPVHLYLFGNKDNILEENDDGNSGSVKRPSLFFAKKHNRLYLSTFDYNSVYCLRLNM